MTQEKLLQFIEQNEKLMQEVTELRKVVKQQDNHLRAYKLKIEELEKELKQKNSLKQKLKDKKEAAKPKKSGIFGAVENLPEDEQYKTIKEFITAFDLKVNEEKQRLLQARKSEINKRIKNYKSELSKLMEMKPMFQFWLKENWENNVKGLEGDIKKAQHELNTTPTVQIESEAIGNIYKLSKTPDLARTEIQEARAFLREYERNQANA
jgi:chromosome segregation ATPase